MHEHSAVRAQIEQHWAALPPWTRPPAPAASPDEPRDLGPGFGERTEPAKETAPLTSNRTSILFLIPQVFLLLHKSYVTFCVNCKISFFALKYRYLFKIILKWERKTI